MASVRFRFELAVEEVPATMFAAKVEGLAVTLDASGGRCINRHAADGVNRHDEIALVVGTRTMASLAVNVLSEAPKK